MRCSKKACAALAAFLILAIPAVACSQKSGAGEGQADSAVQAAAGGSSGRTVIVGKVTDVVGNQVTLAVGTLNRSAAGGSGGFGFRRQSSGASSSPAAASSGTSSSASSSLITLTGETKTVLIPVGLTLSNGFSAGNRTSGRSSGSAGSVSGSAGGGIPQGGGQQTPGSRAAGGFGGTGGTASRLSGSARTSGSGGTAGGTAGAGTLTQRSSDFSSITKGMVLQIVEETSSDGTQGIVSVSVLSR